MIRYFQNSQSHSLKMKHFPEATKAFSENTLEFPKEIE